MSSLNAQVIRVQKAPAKTVVQHHQKPKQRPAKNVNRNQVNNRGRINQPMKFVAQK